MLGREELWYKLITTEDKLSRNANKIQQEMATIKQTLSLWRAFRQRGLRLARGNDVGTSWSCSKKLTSVFNEALFLARGIPRGHIFLFATWLPLIIYTLMKSKLRYWRACREEMLQLTFRNYAMAFKNLINEGNASKCSRQFYNDLRSFCALFEWRSSGSYSI